MSRKIIIPKGLLNPNETAIIEIPPELEDERNLMASRKEEQFYPASAFTPKTITRITKKTVSTSTTTLLNPNIYSRTFPNANDQCPGATCPINFFKSQSKPTPKLVKKRSSKTIIRTSRSKTGQSSLGILGSSYMNYRTASRNQNTCGNPECKEESLVLLKSEASNTSNLSDDSADESLGILGFGYFDGTGETTDESLGILGPSYFDSARSSTGTSLETLGSGYFDNTQSTDSPGILGPGYFDSTRSTANNNLGLLGFAYLDSVSAVGNCSRDSPIVSKTTNKPNSKVTVKTTKSSSSTKLYESFKSSQPNVSPPLNVRGFFQPSSSRSPAFNPHTKILENMVEQSSGRLIKKQSITKTSQPRNLNPNESKGLEQKLKEIENKERRQLGQSLAKYQNTRRNFISNTSYKTTKKRKNQKSFE